ncbi:MAG: hypothetical protein ACREXT_05500, partial [Gammaproteobacteria bacterium]
MKADTLFFERTAPFLKRWPYAFWTLIGLSCAAVATILYTRTHSKVFIATCYPLVLGMIFTPLGVKFGYKILLDWDFHLKNFVDRPHEQILDWYREQLGVFQKIRGALCLGLVGAVIAPYAFAFGGAYVGLTSPFRFAAILIIALAGFIAGVGVSHLFYFSRIVWRLGEHPVAVERHEFGILST